MGSKKTTKTSSNETRTAAPPSWTMPGIQDAAGRVNAAIGQIPTDTYQGDFIAQPDQDALSQIMAAYRNTAQQGTDLSAMLQGQLPALTASPSFSTGLPAAPTFASMLPVNPSTVSANRFELAPEQNLTGVIDSAINPVFRELTEKILPGIRSSALESGAYSGDRAMSVLPTAAIRDSNEAAQRLAASIGYEDYNNRENRRLEAFTGDENRALQARMADADRALQGFGLDTERGLGTADMALRGFNADTERGLGTADLMTQRMSQMPDIIDTIMRTSAGSGDLQRMAADLDTASRQSGIDNALAKEDYGISRPFAGLDIASSLLAALSGGYGTNTATGNSTTVEKTGGLGPIMSGALGLGALAAGMPGGLGGLGGLFGGAAGGAGAAMKAATPMASSIFSSGMNPAALMALAGGRM